MKKFRKMIISLMLVSTSLVVASCGSSDATDADAQSAEAQSAEVQTETTSGDNQAKLDEILPVVESIDELPQFSPMEEGETIATLHTNYGDITMRFFEEYAPKAVENFLTLAEQGYYDGITFHRVINDFMIQGGDPTGTGAGGESIYGDVFENEVTPYLRHFPGAVAMANAGPNTNGSQFYIVENDALDDSEKAYLQDFIDNPDKVIEEDPTTGIKITNDRYCSPVVAEKYMELGGTPYLDLSYTVFGQVIDGMDVVHTIADVETGDKDKPVEDVVIESIDISEYHAQ